MAGRGHEWSGWSGRDLVRLSRTGRAEFGAQNRAVLWTVESKEARPVWPGDGKDSYTDTDTEL